jgi:KUP system potassium uptake protein
MVWHVEHNRALHRTILVVNATIESIPWIEQAQRLHVEQVQPDYWRATARFGFMEKPDLPAVLGRGCTSLPGLDLSSAVYYLGHGTVVGREDDQGLPTWQESMYAAMERNAVHFSDFFRLPSGSVVMIGRQIEI